LKIILKRKEIISFVNCLKINGGNNTTSDTFRWFLSITGIHEWQKRNHWKELFSLCFAEGKIASRAKTAFQIEYI